MKIRYIYLTGFIVISSPIYSKVPSFVGDLVARDLIGLGPLGHVGLATAQDYRMRPYLVLEAMGTVPHIQQNTIDNFKSRSHYWGSKTGLVSPQSLQSYTVAHRIVQQYYTCPEYTVTWKWRAGIMGPNDKPKLCGQFRCDTLINYAYAFDKRYSLPTFNTAWTNPVAVYNYFPVESDLLMPETPVIPVDVQPNTNASLSLINSENISKLKADTFYEMLQNAHDISKEELKSLWDLFAANQVDSKVKILFYDFISFDSPSFLTNAIIKQAKKETGEVRHKLLVILQSIYQNRLNKNKMDGLDNISNYFNELQSENLDKNDASIVFRGLATLSSKPINANTANLTNMDKIHVAITNIENDRVNETKYVADIINNLNNPDDGLVVTASYQYLTQLLINSDLKFFSQESKELFKKHLATKSLVNHTQNMLYTPSYIEFKAALNVKKVQEIPRLANKYLKSLDPEGREVISGGFSDFTRAAPEFQVD